MFGGQRFRILIFLAVAALAAAAGFTHVSPIAALGFVQHFGYFVILVAAVGFAVSLFRIAKSPATRPAWCGADTRLAVICLAIAGLWQLHGPHGFKILMDEYVLNATAMNMHFDREVFVPLKTHDLNGVYATLGGIVDKRPVFFPFLLATVHDFTGYRPGNVFVLNAALSFICLFLAGRFARRLGCNEKAGVLTVILLGGLPLLASNASGAGFELLNLVMLTAVAFLGCRYLERPERATAAALILGTVLLAQTRYESAVFVAATGALIVWGWVRAKQLIVPWSMVAAPALLLLIPFQNKLFTVNRGYWQLDPGVESPFQLRFIPDNFGHAVEFLFAVDGNQLGSPVLSAAGLVCLLVFVLFVLRRWRTLRGEPTLAVFGALTLVVLANFALVLCYHWGQLDDFIASRLGLPLLLVFALAVGFVTGRRVRSQRVWIAMLAISTAWMFIGALPIASRSQATGTFLRFREVEWQREFVREQRNRDFLFILPSPLPAILERQPAMSVDVLAERAEEMAYHWTERTYREVFVFQRLEMDPESRKFYLADQSELGPEFLLETIEERRFKPLTAMRLSRLTGIDLSRRNPRPSDWQPNFPPFEINMTEDDSSPTGAYLQDFLEKLP